MKNIEEIRVLSEEMIKETEKTNDIGVGISMVFPQLGVLYKVFKESLEKLPSSIENWMIHYLLSTIARSLGCKFCEFYHIYYAALIIKDQGLAENIEEGEHETHVRMKKNLLKFLETGSVSIDIHESMDNISVINTTINMVSNLIDRKSSFINDVIDKIIEKSPFNLKEFIAVQNSIILFIPICKAVHNYLSNDLFFRNKVEYLKTLSENSKNGQNLHYSDFIANWIKSYVEKDYQNEKIRRAESKS